MKRRERIRAVALRKAGLSIKQIALALKVSKATVSVWVREVPLSVAAKERLEATYTAGQLASQMAQRRKTSEKERLARELARDTVTRLSPTAETKMVLCALVYFCEGAKRYSGKGQFSFTNSDPLLVAGFLRLFRDSFSPDESRFRVCMHLHGYHDESKQLKFWSRTTNIPRGQFVRTFWKRESGISIRNGYQGCVSIRYHDVRAHRLILATADEFLKGL